MSNEIKELMIDGYLESIGHDFQKSPISRIHYSPSRGLVEVYCAGEAFPVPIDMLDLLAFVYSRVNMK